MVWVWVQIQRKMLGSDGYLFRGYLLSRHKLKVPYNNSILWKWPICLQPSIPTPMQLTIVYNPFFFSKSRTYPYTLLQTWFHTNHCRNLVLEDSIKHNNIVWPHHTILVQKQWLPCVYTLDLISSFNHEDYRFNTCNQLGLKLKKDKHQTKLNHIIHAYHAQSYQQLKYHTSYALQKCSVFTKTKCGLVLINTTPAILSLLENTGPTFIPICFTYNEVVYFWWTLH